MKAPHALFAAPLLLATAGAALPAEDVWLSDADDPRTRAWVEARNSEYRKHIDAIPERRVIEAELRGMDGGASGPSTLQVQTRDGHLWLLRSLPDRPHPVITTGDGRVVFDPATVSEPGSWTIDWFAPSPDGKLIAVSVSPDGTERGSLHVVDAASGRTVERPIRNVNNATAGGDLAWLPDGSGFLYTRYPQTDDMAAGSVDQRLHLHRVGTDPRADALEFGSDLGRLVEIRVIVQPGTGRAIAWAQDGDSGRFSIHFRRGPGTWERVAGFEDEAFQPVFGDGDDVYLLSYAGAPNGRVLRVDWAGPELRSAAVLVAERPDAALGHSFYSKGAPSAIWAGDRLHLVYQRGGPNALATVDASGRSLSFDEFGEPTAITGLSILPDGALAVSTETFLRDAAWFRRAPDGSLGPLLRNESAPARWDDVEAVRRTARSRDGTQVPYTVVRRRGRTGASPALVGAYGGFGISRRPTFRRGAKVLLDRGIVVGDVNIRGGGEYGDRWRRAAMGTGRQRAYEDFQAVLQDLHAKGLSTPALTAIEGASNGGLLMGVTLTQRPDLARTVLADVGLYDMLRFEKGVNGAFNVAEYGRLDLPAERAAMLAYSPLQQVRRGVDYPAVLFTVGANDPRVDPAHSRRMLAALRQADKGADPVLLRTDQGAGHGYSATRTDRLSAEADAYAFLLARFRSAGWKEKRR